MLRKIGVKAPIPGFIEPQLATLKTKPPKGDYLHEIKFDGYRAQVHLLRRRRCDLFACSVTLKRRQPCPQRLVDAVLAQQAMGRMSCEGVPARVHEYAASKGGQVCASVPYKLPRTFAE